MEPEFDISKTFWVISCSPLFMMEIKRMHFCRFQPVHWVKWLSSAIFFIFPNLPPIFLTVVITSFINLCFTNFFCLMKFEKYSGVRKHRINMTKFFTVSMNYLDHFMNHRKCLSWILKKIDSLFHCWVQHLARLGCSWTPLEKLSLWSNHQMTGRPKNE